MSFSHESRFEAAGPHVIYEILDGEAVIINLDCGHYFGFDETATRIWNDLIVCQNPLSEALRVLRQNYTGDENLMAEALQEFVLALQQEGLIRASAASGPETKTEAAHLSSPVKAFTPPSFKKYTDMQDFLLVDPIHDVSESGWPERKHDAVKPLS